MAKPLSLKTLSTFLLVGCAPGTVAESHAESALGDSVDAAGVGPADGGPATSTAFRGAEFAGPDGLTARYAIAVAGDVRYTEATFTRGATQLTLACAADRGPGESSQPYVGQAIVASDQSMQRTIECEKTGESSTGRAYVRATLVVNRATRHIRITGWGEAIQPNGVLSDDFRLLVGPSPDPAWVPRGAGLAAGKEYEMPLTLVSDVPDLDGNPLALLGRAVDAATPLLGRALDPAVRTATIDDTFKLGTVYIEVGAQPAPLSAYVSVAFAHPSRSLAMRAEAISGLRRVSLLDSPAAGAPVADVPTLTARFQKALKLE